jgi:hypothetical protein
MKAKKFLELSNAKSLAVLTATSVLLLSLTKTFSFVPEILMVFLGISSLIKVKVKGINFSEKKSQLKKGIFSSLLILILAFLIQRIFSFNLFIELTLMAMVLLLLKEIYSKKKDKWINSFVLMGSVLLTSGIILLIKLALNA